MTPDERIFALVEDCASRKIEVSFELLKLSDQTNESFDAEANNDNNRCVLSDSQLKNSEKLNDINNHQSNHQNTSNYFLPLQQQQNLFHLQQQVNGEDFICAKLFPYTSK